MWGACHDSADGKIRQLTATGVGIDARERNTPTPLSFCNFRYHKNGSMAKLICVKTYPGWPEAEIAKQFLGAHEIKAVLSGDDSGGMRPDLLKATGGVRLLCREEDSEKALDLLESV